MKTTISAKRLKHVLKIVVINGALLALLLELGSSAAYLVHTGEFFYTRKARTSHSENLASTAQSGISVNDKILFQLHPYFGFAQRGDLDFRFPDSKIAHHPNNWGFYSDYDYPFKRQSENQFIIGILGGSVAQSVAMFELENHTLTKVLQQLPYFKDKEIIVLPFTLGAYKQPQQLLILNYFLGVGQDLDLVINIDGFNEVALSYLNYQNGMDISMPNYLIVMPLVDLANKNLTFEEMDLTLEILKGKSKISSADAGLESCTLASSYVVQWLRLKYLTKKYNREVQRFNELSRAKLRDDKSSLVRIYPNNSALSDTVVLERIASMWATSSLLMKATLDSRRSLYFHVLQPNQHYQTDRRFGEAEMKVAFGGPSPYREGIIKGYPLLLSKVSLLRQSNENFFNATRIFDQTPGAVYGDNCCHYNRAGNELFVNYIAKSIAVALAGYPKVESTSGR